MHRPETGSQNRVSDAVRARWGAIVGTGRWVVDSGFQCQVGYSYRKLRVGNFEIPFNGGYAAYMRGHVTTMFNWFGLLREF